MYIKGIFFLILFFLELHAATNGLLASFLPSHNITPFITINDRHINSFKVLYNYKKNKPYLLGLHHDYQNQYKNRGLVQFSNIIKGPMGSFSAHVAIAGVDYGIKTLFSSEWSYQKIVALLVMICVQRYGNMTCEEYRQSLKREIFHGLIEQKLLVRIVFDKQKYQVISAYPLI